ncbi:fasciclin domain-containing protein [Tsuneonella sp. YG55]|uniref:Fasciclin domain-containing protein n=2 Tax=Tsuneonella litorea TaxID=2976475 RepID=A0A9X2W3X6_9SPHN|nr:fasciclin domain-containing protein [Tsuneonella litorea]
MPKMNPIAAAAALALLSPLAACSQSDNASEADGPTTSAANRTLAAAIGGAPDLTTLSGALSEAGLADIFDGPGSYTILAPDDGAFGSTDGETAALKDDAHRAELVAVLRGHILPGHLTLDAIRKAIADRKGPVTMTTLDDGEVTFSEVGGSVVVTGSDGSKATIEGDPLVASNGVVLPVDGFVKQPEVAPAA